MCWRRRPPVAHLLAAWTPLKVAEPRSTHKPLGCVKFVQTAQRHQGLMCQSVVFPCRLRQTPLIRETCLTSSSCSGGNSTENPANPPDLRHEKQLFLRWNSVTVLGTKWLRRAIDGLALNPSKCLLFRCVSV